MNDDVLNRLADLERRVAALESGARADGTGMVGYRGRTEEPLELEWEITVTPARALALDDGPRAEVLAALGNPARLAIVRALAARGPQPAAALQEAAGLGSTGQLYHHLKALTGAGIVEPDKRGSYRLPARATIPVLVLLTAAADVAGQLR
ncbi:ArsR/SmtB family transcription factor [Amycolatopsis thermoflava]|uniref:ArsR/SmtB family transcription factor n=1 Tax=Amycolatopsis TaxID=1813 RepID=UPI00365884AB